MSELIKKVLFILIGLSNMPLFDIKEVEDKEQLACLASKLISDQIRFGLKNKDRFQMALSGGATPRMTYELLREELLPWSRVQIILGDERWVPHDDESSNALMVRQTLLALGPGSEASFYPTPTVEFPTPQDSAKEFSKIIKDICNDNSPCLDLILLGLGDDGHTASLFPGTDSLNVRNSLTTVSTGKGTKRITLTASAISSASKVIFLVSGEGKQVALKRLLDPNESYKRTPAKLIRPDSEIVLLVDKAASALL